MSSCLTFCGEVNAEKVDKIHERALRFIYEDYSASYDELLSKSKLPLAIEVYKVINKECPVYLQDLIHIKNNSYSSR